MNQGDRSLGATGADRVYQYILKFVAELRASGLPISTGAVVDALTALRGVSLTDLRTLRVALESNLVSSPSQQTIFSLVFDTYFDSAPVGEVGELREIDAERPLVELDDGELRVLLRTALTEGDRHMLELIATEAVARNSRMVSGRASGVNFHAFKSLRPLSVDSILDEIEDEDRANGVTPVAGLLRREERSELSDYLSSRVRREVRRRLVADRGAEAVGKTLRTSLPEDVDFLRASAEQLGDMESAIAPLGRRLARRLGRQGTGRRSTRVNFGATSRKSLAYGGVPADLRFHRPRLRRPELVVIADVSGSVASFAGFTIQLMLGVQSTFAKVRTFAFIDGIDEVTEQVSASRDIAGAIEHLNETADIIWHDGHSDYGNALSAFWERWGTEIGRRTTVLVLGDARNNYLATESEILTRIRRRAGALYWLNPEPKDRWGTGDSVIEEYGRRCDAVIECRTLRQLEHFVEGLA